MIGLAFARKKTIPTDVTPATDPLLQKLEQLVAEIDQLVPLLRFVPEGVLTQPTPAGPAALVSLLDISRVDAEVLVALDPDKTIPSPPPADHIEAVLGHVREMRLLLVQAAGETTSEARLSLEYAISHSTDVLRRIGQRLLESRI